MIELNLLPKELRKKRKKRASLIPQLQALPVLFLTIGVLGVIYIGLFFFARTNSSLSGELKEKWDQMKPQRVKTEQMIREINALEKKLEALRKIVKPDLDWARLLSGLNQAMIPNVWLSEFEPQFGSKSKKGMGKGIPKTLKITGYVLGKSEEATKTLGKFIRSQENNRDFFDYFEEIELQNMRNQKIAGEEVMLFILKCKFKPITYVEGNKSKKKKGKKRR